MKLKAVIFDYDGVIHDTFDFHKQHIEAFTGKPINAEEYRDAHNGNFFTNKHDRLKDVDWLGYKDFIYEPQLKLKTEEKIKNTLLDLGEKYDLFIVSSGGTKNISDYLDKNSLGGIFKEVMGAEQSRSKSERFKYLSQKYSFGLDECVFVTDTLGDILEANEVGIKTIAVDFGYHTKENLAKGKPAKIISDFSQIPEAIEKERLKI